MSANRPLTVRLEAQDYERLEREAARLGMRPGTLARVLLRASLGAPERQPEHPPVSLERLFDRLARLREDLPPVDAAAVVAETVPTWNTAGSPGSSSMQACWWRWFQVTHAPAQWVPGSHDGWRRAKGSTRRH